MLPLHRLFTALQSAGLFIGPAERLRVQQLLAESPAAWQTAEGRAALMYELAPLLCRNRVEQEAFYKAYQAFSEELAVPVDFPEEEKNTFWKKYGKILAWALGLLALLAAGWWLWQNTRPEEQVRVTFDLKSSSKTPYAPGDTLTFTNTTRVNDPSAVQFEWHIKERDKPDQPTDFRDTTSQLNYFAPMPSDGKRATFEAILRAKNIQSGEIHHEANTTFEVVFPCNSPPKVEEAISVEGILLKGQNIKIFAPKDAQKHHKFKWTFEDVAGFSDTTIYARNPVYRVPKVGPITLEVSITDTTQTGYCTTTLTKEIFIQEDIPTLAALPLYKDEVKPLWAYTWLTIAIALLAFALAVWFAWRWWHRPSITIPPPAPNIPDALRRAFETEPADKTPYSIPHRSNNSQIRIAAEQIELANTFRRRQEGQVALLNIPRSINATMEKLGYAELRFSYNTRPTHYLFLIDLQNEVSHQAQLFRYLVEMLEGQDVLADVFFYKNSLSRCWNNLHPEGLALDQLALQYADRRLVVFGDGYRLLSETDEDDGVLHKEQAEALRRWPQRMLLTPAPVAAWTYREARLYQLWAVFHADLGGLMQAARFVEAGMDDENLPPTFAEWKRQCQRSLVDADTDRDWDTPAEHRDYLREANDRDGALYRWLRALSVYPELNWNVTIAIGRALGIDVRYEHLLVLARIPWLQSGTMKPSLWRAWMREMPLPGVEPDETQAREAVRAELRAVEALCAEGYADQQMQTRLAVQDFALAPTDRDAQDRLYYILQHIAPAPLLTEELDRTVQRNIPDFQWTGGEKPGRALAFLHAGQPQPTVQRPFWTRNLLWCALCWPFFLLPLLVAPKHWAGLHERYPMVTGLFVVPQEDEAVRLNNRGVEVYYSNAMNENFKYKIFADVPGGEFLVRGTKYFTAFHLFNEGISISEGGNYPLAATNRAKIFFNNGLNLINAKDNSGLPGIGASEREAKEQRVRGIEMLKIAQQNDSLHLPAAEALAIAYYQNNQPDSACFWMGQVLALKPDYRNWLVEKGLCNPNTTCRQIINVNYSVALRNKNLTSAEINEIAKNPSGDLDRQTLITTIPLGRTVDVIDSTQNFWKIRYSTQIGYIAKTVNGKPLLGPCIMLRDRDGDGVSDENDRCPDEKGDLKNGCPSKMTDISSDSTGFRGKYYFKNQFDVNGLTQTTIKLYEGDIVKIKASGSIRTGSFQGVSGPNGLISGILGVTFESYKIAKENNFMSLMYRTSSQQNWQFAGENIEFEAIIAGLLEFEINDLEQGNNTGSYKVTVSISQSHGTEKSPISEMIPIPGGTFTMGCTNEQQDCDSDEKTTREVTLSSFWMAKNELTFDEYDAFCEATKSDKPDDEGWGRGKRPVINVSWNDAVAYCNWRSQQDGFTPCYTFNENSITCNWQANGYRLPTEAEWEYTARGGTDWAQGYKFAGSNTIDEVAWYDDNSGSTTHPVAQKKPNQRGLYDMSGNVYEWCGDWYDENYYQNFVKEKAINPTGPKDGSYRVFRGGSWNFNPLHCRVANRNFYSPGIRSFSIGFRLARTN